MSEFDLIARYFTRATPGAVLGVGDDAALLNVPSGMELVITTDMLVAGTHFFPDADPFLLGHKTLAVNLSDLAAMGAKPCWALLAASMPAADEAWLKQFSDGFFALARVHGVELVGGDTTQGPLNLCATLMGVVPSGMALRRDGAQVGDDIWVSGRLGCAAAALAHLKGEIALKEKDFAACALKLHKPEPRVTLGLALRGFAHSAIDISDGLLADLGHILERSQVGAEIVFDDIPAPAALSALFGTAGEDKARRCLLSGGDDYELCFTAPATCRHALAEICGPLDLPLTRIGTIVAGSGCVVKTKSGERILMEETGYDHFR